MSDSSTAEQEDRGVLAWEHSRVRATRPIRVAVAFLMAALVLGPQSLRFAGRDAAAVLQPTLAVDSTAIGHAALIVSGAVTGMVLVASRPVRRYWAEVIQYSSRARLCLRGLAVWVAFTGLSVMWSVAPLYTFVSWLRLAGLACLAAVLVAFGRDRLSLVRFFWWFSLAKILSIAALGILDPSLVGRDIVVGYRLTGGVFPDYGTSGVVLVLASLALYRAGYLPGTSGNVLFHRRWFMFGCLALGVGFTLLARSRFSIVALCAVLALAAWSFRARLLALLGFAAVIGVALVDTRAVNDGIYTVLFRGREVLSGASARHLALEHVLVWSADDRLIGAGFAAGSRAAMVDFLRATGIEMGAPHDVVSAVVPDTGLLGLLILVLLGTLLLRGLVGGVTSLRVPVLQPLALFVTGMVLLAFATSAASAGIASADLLATVPFVAIAVFERRRAEMAGHIMPRTVPLEGGSSAGSSTLT